MNELPVILQVHKFYAKVMKITEKLPSLQKQTLGRRLEDGVLGLLEYLIMAKNAPKHLKAPYLIKATALAEILMFLLRTFAVFGQFVANARGVIFFRLDNPTLGFNALDIIKGFDEFPNIFYFSINEKRA
jgi:hypothetical protein